MKTTNHEYYVSLEVAKLLKEAGFDWEVNTCRYNLSPDKVSSNGTLKSNFNGYAFQHIAISAPTLDVAQRWLREVKNADIFALRDNRDSLYYNFGECDKFPFITSDKYFDTYEQALEEGIKKILEIILDKGK